MQKRELNHCRLGRLDLEVDSSYVEDGNLNVLVLTVIPSEEQPDDPEPRWTLIADPVTRQLLRMNFCVSTEDGFGHPQYTPTKEQMNLSRKFVKAA